MANLNRPGLSLNGFGPGSLDSPFSNRTGMLLYAPFLKDSLGYSLVTGQRIALSTETVDADGTRRSWGRHQIVQAIANTARIIYGYGLLSEIAQTNHLTRSADITHADWVNIGTPTHAGAAIQVPDLSTNGQPVGDDDGAALEGKKQLFVGTAKPWALSYHFKEKAGTCFPGLRLHKAAVTTGDAIFNLSTGEALPGTVNAPDSVGIEYCGDGWFRCWVTDTLTAVADWEAHVYPAMADTFDGGVDVAAVGQVYAWGGQNEIDITPSEYIPTVAASVARAGDALAFDNTAEVHLKGAAGTVSMVFYPQWSGNAFDNGYLFDCRKAGNEGIAAFHPKNVETVKLVCENDAGVEQANFSGACPHVRGTPEVLTFIWDTNNFNILLNGASIATDVAGTPDTSGPEIFIGQRYTGGSQANGIIAHVTIWDHALTVAQAYNDYVEKNRMIL